MEEEIKVHEIEENIWEIPKEGDMLVPGRVFASKEMMELLKRDKTLSQVKNMATMPGIQKYAMAMSDAHQGYGFCVGGVAAFDMEKGCISPGGTGFDINCGVRTLTTNLSKEEVYPKIKELLDALFNNIHCGVGSESSVKLSFEEIDDVLNRGMQWGKEKGYATDEDIDHCEENGTMKSADATKVSQSAKARGRKQLGTLGAGNHFGEVQYVDEIFDEKVAKAFGINKVGQVVFMIHSGSRGLGHQVCTDYLRRCERELPEIMKKLPEKDLAYAPAGSDLANDYLKAMSAAANFGWCNRQLMTHFARNAFNEIFPSSELKLVYDVAHNIVKQEKYNIDGEKKKLFVHRKGATRAFGPGNPEIPEVYRDVGQPIIIPGSMGTSSWLLVGTKKAEELTFGSTPHGAGRMMSRTQANKEFTGEGIKKELEAMNIFVKSKSWRGISEEAPRAYKDVTAVIEVAHKLGFGLKVARLKPIGVIKG
jgi:tRNA-splicing ligase RtcB (3'-phosphate/5'-hydroxy nucleic acid ligase)